MIKRLLSFVLLVSITFAVFAQPAGYYDNANGKSGATLKTALYNIIKGHTDVGYDGLYNVYLTSDNIVINGSSKVYDMYSIKANGTADYYFSHVSGDRCGSYSGESDCYNREHTFCDSWLGKASPQRSDAHHIVPTDGYVNNRRSSFPHGKVGSTSWTSSNGGKLGSSDASTGYSGTVFEPIDEYKGDFARMYFYVATRYEDKIAGWASNGSAGEILAGNSFPAYKTWFKDLMLQWHQQDPVSQKELDRNNAIYTYQHNRNPYIDNPEYAQAVWGNGTIELSFTSSPVTSVTQGQPYSYAVKVTGPVGATFSITAPTKPAWLTLAAGTNGNATLSGTPSAAGSDNVTLSVTDGTTTKTQSFIITISALDGLKFNSSPILSATTGSQYSYSIVATNQSNSSATITIGATTKPAWLTLTSTGNGTATLSGTPSVAGSDNVSLTANDGTTTVNQNFTIAVGQAGQNKTETFTNLVVVADVYSNQSWTGDDGSNWTTSLARTDQTLNGKAICLKNVAGTYVQSGTLSGGCKSLSFKVIQVFSGTGGALTLYINNVAIGSPYSYNATEQTATFSNINVAGDFVIKLENNGTARPVIDDVTWTGYTGVNALPTITEITNNPFSPTTDDDVLISAKVSDSDGTISSVELKWGLSQGSLSNTLAMALDGAVYKATIPKQAAGTVYFSITAKDNSNATSTETSSYSVILNQKPTISNIANLPASPFAGQAIKVSADIADADGSIEDVWLNWGTSPTLLSNQLTLAIVDGKYETTIPAQTSAGTIYLSISARDDNGAVTSITYNFVIAQNAVPTITNINRSPLNPYIGETVTISATVNDSDGTIQEVLLKWGTSVNSLSNTLTMAIDGGVYKAVIPAQLSAGTIYTSINARDNKDAITTVLYEYVVLQTNQLPTMSSITRSPQSPLTGQAITVSANITDSDGTIQEAWLLWGTSAGNLSNNVAMTLSGGKYLATIPAQSSAGTIYTSINAKDNLNGVKSTPYNFIVSQNHAPVITEIATTPQTPLTGQAISVSANIVDNDGSVQQAWVKWGTTANDLSNSVNMTYSNGKYNATIPAQTSTTTIYLSVNAKDNLAAESSSLFNFAIAQNQLPSITNITISPLSPTVGQAVTVSATITDADGNILEAWIDWGTASNSLTNRVNLSISSGVGIGLIPAQSASGTIYLKVTAKDNSQEMSNATFSFSISPSTGIDELNKNAEIKVYPNPARNVIYIDINEKRASTITISNIIGETLINELYNGGKQPIDISKLKSGVYFVIVTGEDFRNTIRIVKF